MSDEVRVGVSACLLGEAVRHDGGHKREPIVADVLARLVRLVPVCPEVEIGLGTPREPIRLEREGGGVRLVGIVSRRDLTRAMDDYSRRKLDELSLLGLSGYILKKSSPSCGADRVPVTDSRGSAVGYAAGRFAAALRDRWPLLPIEEEDRLADATTLRSFLERVLAYHRLRRSG
ncbi:MAG: DUF523 domain-containing protein [Candidatus Binatia bacterium]